MVLSFSSQYTVFYSMKILRTTFTAILVMKGLMINGQQKTMKTGSALLRKRRMIMKPGMMTTESEADNDEVEDG